MYNLRETKNIPQDRIGIEDTVDVKSWVDEQSRVENITPNVTTRICLGRFAWKGEESCVWWIGHMFIHISGVVAGHGLFVKMRHKGLTEPIKSDGYDKESLSK